MRAPRLSVITVTRQRRELLLRKLDSLEQQEIPHEDFEWVVCDNASDDGSAQVLRHLEPTFRLHVVSSRELLGPGAARNACVRASSGEILYFSDDDCLLEPDTLKQHLRAQSTACVAIGSIRFEPVSGPIRLWRRSRVGFWNCNGANTSVPANEFHRVGGFDDDLAGYGGEDVLLGYRLASIGLPFESLPDALVRHIGPDPMTAGDPDKAGSAGRNAVRIADRYPELALRLGVHPLSLGLKRALLSPPLNLAWRIIDGSSYRYEKAYLDGALGELGRRGTAEGVDA